MIFVTLFFQARSRAGSDNGSNNEERFSSLEEDEEASPSENEEDCYEELKQYYSQKDFESLSKYEKGNCLNRLRRYNKAVIDLGEICHACLVFYSWACSLHN